MDFRSTAFLADPYPSYRFLRDHAPFWREPHSGHVYVTRYDDVRALLLDPSLSSDRTEERLHRVAGGEADALRPILHDRLLMTDGAHHRALRQQVGASFTAAQIRRCSDLVAGIVDDELRGIDWSRPVDVLNQLAIPIPSRVILSVLGFHEDDHAALRRWTDAFYEWLASSPGSIEARTARAVHATAHIHDLVVAEVARSREAPSDTMLGHLATSVAAGQLTDDEVVANLIGIVNAAHETTTSLLVNGTLALLQNPDQLALLVEDPELLDAAVDEMLRFDGPAQIVSRLVVDERQIGDVLCVPGTLVALVIGSANRDERAYDDPDRFDVRREGSTSLSMGHGAHYCVGSALAKLEAIEFFRRVVPRLVDARLVTDPVTWRPTPAFRCPSALVVDFGRP